MPGSCFEHPCLDQAPMASLRGLGGLGSRQREVAGRHQARIQELAGGLRTSMGSHTGRAIRPSLRAIAIFA
jgi:hypothetical protein